MDTSNPSRNFTIFSPHLQYIHCQLCWFIASKSLLHSIVHIEPRVVMKSSRYAIGSLQFLQMTCTGVVFSTSWALSSLSVSLFSTMLICACLKQYCQLSYHYSDIIIVYYFVMYFFFFFLEFCKEKTLFIPRYMEEKRVTLPILKISENMKISTFQPFWKFSCFTCI